MLRFAILLLRSRRHVPDNEYVTLFFFAAMVSRKKCGPKPNIRKKPNTVTKKSTTVQKINKRISSKNYVKKKQNNNKIKKV